MVTIHSDLELVMYGHSDRRGFLMELMREQRSLELV
jgi:hypothetical protein